MLLLLDGKDIAIASLAHSNNDTSITVSSYADDDDDGNDALISNQTTNLDGTSSGTPNNSTRISGRIDFHSSQAYTVKSGATAAAGSIFNNATASEIQGSDAKKLSTVDISSAEGAQNAIKILDASLAQISGFRGDLGAIQNRFDATITSLQATSENLSAARSRILDADFAKETADLTKSQIMVQAGTAMLAQANQVPQGVLSLLG